MRIVAENATHSSYTHAFCAIGNGGTTMQQLLALGASAKALSRNATIPSLGAINSLYQHFRKLRPVVVHLHGAEANFHGTIAARLAGVPVVVAEEIGIPRHSKKARAVFRQIYGLCDKVVAISEAVAESIIALGEVKRDQIAVIHNPFSFQVFRKPIERCGHLMLGFVGRLEAVKNPLCAIEALSLLRQQNIDASLVMIGDGSQRSLLTDRIETLGLVAHVTLVGFHPRPFDLLKGCHFFLQPSVTEGFGLAICEAMSAGIPVIASAVGGAPEIITDGLTPWGGPVSVLMHDGLLGHRLGR